MGITDLTDATADGSYRLQLAQGLSYRVPADLILSSIAPVRDSDAIAILRSASIFLPVLSLAEHVHRPFS
jgi:hypothetical protein